ncbi:MAG: hypothetical protein WAX69_06890 [Victivallales bacterium]
MDSNKTKTLLWVEYTVLAMAGLIILLPLIGIILIFVVPVTGGNPDDIMGHSILFFIPAKCAFGISILMLVFTLVFIRKTRMFFRIIGLSPLLYALCPYVFIEFAYPLCKLLIH